MTMRAIARSGHFNQSTFGHNALSRMHIHLSLHAWLLVWYVTEALSQDLGGTVVPFSCFVVVREYLPSRPTSDLPRTALLASLGKIVAPSW